MQDTIQQSLNDLRLSVIPWHASMASPLRAPDHLNVNNSLQFVNNVVSPINEKLNVQIIPDKSNGTNVVDSVIDKRSLQIVDVSIYTLTSSKSDGMLNKTYKEQSKFIISVRIQGITEEIKLVDNDAFVDVFPSSAIFYLSGIDTLFLTMLNVKTIVRQI